MELIRALAVLAEPPQPESARLAALLELPQAPEAWEHTRLFVEQLYPYASVYLGPEGRLGGASRELIGGFWSALGEVPPPEPDHLSVLLGLYARLAELERDADEAPRRAAWRRARGALLWEHLLSWLVLWLPKLAAVASPTYRAWGELLEAALTTEARGLEPPADLPLQLRDAPGLESPGDVAAPVFLSQLLAPARSGLIVTRSDLKAAAAALGLGLRAGERAYAMRALMAQDAPAVFGWLARMGQSEGAALTARADSARCTALTDVYRFWAGRARATARLTADLTTV